MIYYVVAGLVTALTLRAHVFENEKFFYDADYLKSFTFFASVLGQAYAFIYLAYVEAQKQEIDFFS